MAYIVLVTLRTELGGLHCIGDSGDRAGWPTLYLVALGTELDGLHCIGNSGDRA